MIIDIDVVSDFVCPWCFLGKHRLDKALAELSAERPQLRFRINWLPYFLNPDTPPQGEPYRDFIEGKFGGARQADEMLRRVAEAAQPDGLHFAFERIQTRPSTLDAHRLAYRAQSLGQRPERIVALVDGLFRGHFQDGLDIGDRGVLADLAARIGDERLRVEDYLASDEGVAEVTRMAGQVQREGVSGVPFFIIDRRLAVSGAQSSGVLGAALLQALEAR
ncbi:MAG: DsbA family oxidoreductase [Rhodocyclaceae bacterium]